MFCRVGTLFSQPVTQPFAGASLSECLLSSETTRLESFLEQAQLRHSPLEAFPAFGHLSRESDHEPESILEIAHLCSGNQALHIESLVAKQEPGKGFYEPGLQLIEPKTAQEDLFRIPQRPGSLSIDVAGITQPCKLHLNPFICRSFPERELRGDRKSRGGQIK